MGYFRGLERSIRDNMAGYKVYDFECASCGEKWEDLVKERVSICPNCGAVETPQLCAPRLNTVNLMDKTSYTNMMKKRSDDHTARQLKKGEKA
jgi:uncharacterized Zn finger protein